MFVINQKLFLLAKMKDLLKYTISVDQNILPFESVSEKSEENTFHYCSPSNGNNGFKENMYERISFKSKENPLPLEGIKDSFKIYFRQMEKLLLVERISKRLEENRFHKPENQFPPARTKNLL